MKRKVAIYARVSTEHEAQINALENQIQYYDNILEQHPEWELVGRYVDEGITGTSVKKRKNFLRMMEDAKNGMFSLILTREVSRFARNTVDTLQETRKLKSYGVEVYFTEDNIRTSDDTDGELRLTLMATLAQNESKKTSVRVKAGQKISFENGVLYGNGNILGYDRVGRELVVNPEQAETVKMIFNMYHDGMGCKQIAYELEKRGRITSTGLTHWQPGTISRLLRNSFYCGKIVYRKQYVPNYLEQKKINNYDEVEKIEIMGKHEPIISEELFNDCQRRLDAKTVNRLRGKHAINPPKSAYARILKCQCGSNFERRKWHKYKDGRIRYGFECYKQKNHGSYRTRLKKGLDTTGCCTTKMFPEWKLKIVAHWLFNDLWKERDKIINRAIEMLNATIKDENVVDYTDEVKELNKKRKKYEEKLSNLVELRVEGDISYILSAPEWGAKNLFVRDDKKRNYYLITMKGNKRVDLKAFRRQRGLRALSFAAAEELFDIMKLIPGAVTPLGILNDAEHRVQVFMDVEFVGNKIGVHPNDNTATVWMQADDLMKIIQKHGNTVEYACI